MEIILVILTEADMFDLMSNKKDKAVMCLLICARKYMILTVHPQAAACSALTDFLLRLPPRGVENLTSLIFQWHLISLSLAARENASALKMEDPAAC